MRILVCGDRKWTNWLLIWKDLALRANYGPLAIIDGHAKGADRIAHALAYGFGWDNKCFPADWTRYGKAAGPIRNQQMLDEGKPDLVLAYHNDLAHSKGTADMVRRAKKANIPVMIVKEPLP